ncbi:CDP-diacylglycerol--glycerol-3-phosphate 3-phosphatidyltransferase [Candidatus Dependentiae bacterium Noda2021]|nr:CDP-diacylglycerol--glycerol-3-phosphate 3-phosphatidyltransferase [Candidatus Dependentiae bacterium Noda2021]
MVFGNHVNTPTQLTLLRLLVSPFILPIFLYLLLPYDNFFINSTLAFLFILLSLTDFFDGYLARRYSQETKIGKSLDHVADKFLVYATLVVLLAVKKIFFYWVIIFIGREFFVMALRIVALEHNLQVPVSAFGKIKTATQMALLTFLIINPYQHDSLAYAPYWWFVNSFLIFLALFFSLFSAFLYALSFWRVFSVLHIKQS